ncbi:acetylornithine deacetylase [Dacryopinax primogenitus]|uniref:Acetylornithine deacetylase n=1 Tax=Dacryopinax primogenitus (strain DJM 731) TaxID=1858805 RepID=M5FNU0_DACPD|nr:acetylornithine deacetylase [Dacryopinax primogenitus]EJT96558.1 acetylornithine deacetylase [Dacryopinax primogenitus]
MTTLTPGQRARIKDATYRLLQPCTVFLQQLVRIDTTNPPGWNYPECARLIGDTLSSLGYDVDYYEVPECDLPRLAPHGKGLPRVNVIGRHEFAAGQGKVLHFNGHYDVVPCSEPAAWASQPFEAAIRRSADGKEEIVGRGVSDMKGGIAAQVFAIEALKLAGLRLKGTVEHSGVVDEETTGINNAGMGYLVDIGVISPKKQSAIVITEPLNTTNVCLGHRGAIWGRIIFKGVETHGSTPQRGKNALAMAARYIVAAEEEIGASLKNKVDTRVVPPEAQTASLTFTIFNSGHATNLVPAVATLTFDRRLVPGETLDLARGEMQSLLRKLFHDDEWIYEETYSTEPVWVGEEEEIVQVWKRAVHDACNVTAGIVCSPGSDDQRFVVHDARLNSCIVYGPGNIRNVHNLNESLPLEDLRTGMEVMALGAAMYLGFEDIQIQL